MLSACVTQNLPVNIRKTAKVYSLSQWRNYFKVSSMFPQPNWKPATTPDTADNSCQSMTLMLNTRLIERASTGTFYFTPSLTRSLEKLCRIIDTEMGSIGAQKITLPCLAPGDIWKASKRWEEMGSELLKLKDRHDRDHCLAPTHEEAVTKLVADFTVSYKNLPIKLYQIGRKFRDEGQPQHGLLRCREFEMKDLYSFDQDLEHAQETYEHVSEAYVRIYKRLGLDYVRVSASSGAMGGTTSHEFHLLSDIGEDTLYQCTSCDQYYNNELVTETNDSDQTFHCTHCEKNCTYLKHAAIEVSHSFILGTKYSDVFDAKYNSKSGKSVPYYMGCYGIGVTRLLAAAVEVLSRGNGIQWPRVLAPYQIVIVPQKKGHKWEETYQLAEQLCTQLERFAHLKNEVLLDDRLDKLSIGARVNLAKYMGIPHIVTVGKKSLDDPPLYEYIDVYNDKVSYFKDSELMGLFSGLDTVNLEY